MWMTENQKKVIGMTLMQFDANVPVTEEAILNFVNVFSTVNPLTDEEKNEVIRELHASLSVRIDRGACVKEKDHVPWYNAAKADIRPVFWDRYRMYLQKEQGWNVKILDELERSTDEIMDLLGNPRQADGFQRRGLCIGDVQSGKTSNYIGLINKAADAGYRVIILLTGTIEKLRRQTQGRIDEGFIGLDSTAFTRDNKNDVWVGVGCINPSVSGWAVTSTSSDFNAATAKKIVGQLSSINAPVIFVLKKNKSVLEKLEKWLRLYNATTISEKTKKIELPMLLIDDEADNASVNTKDMDSPTAINAAIRKLLKLFVKANYVGFTATPYANIFIDPDSETEMLESDLFPRHFIYALEAPTNYIGASKVFSEDAPYSFMLKSNDDCEAQLPLKHKNGSVMRAFPRSLEEAVASFFIANAVRDLRGAEKTHRTMMINVSRFISVQDQIAKAVDGFVRTMQREIQNYYLLGPDALRYDAFMLLKEVFDTHFAVIPDFEFSWDKIQRALKDAVMPIIVRTVNGGNAPKNLNYDEVEDGLRLIAVGGMSLSRGLTLEGLCVSYFYRNSMMYDTLMQMGRWFGYRGGYADICQVWMPGVAISWYSYISEATDELRREVRRMQEANRTPEDFGLCVRSDIASLLVTARNKMKTAQDYEMMISLDGRVVETPYLHNDPVVLKRNLDVTREFLEKLNRKYTLHQNDPGLAIKHPQYLDVEKADVLDFLGLFSSHGMNADFHIDDIVQLIEKNMDGTLDTWDVTVAGGDGDPVTFPGFSVSAIKRTFAVHDTPAYLQMSGKNSRLGSKNLAKGGLAKKKAQEMEERERSNPNSSGKKSFSQEVYFKSGIQRNPLLVIYPVELSVPDESDDRKMAAKKAAPPAIIGLSIGIPRIDGRESKKYTYKVNIIKWRELFDVDDDDFEEVDETIPEETV